MNADVTIQASGTGSKVRIGSTSGTDIAGQVNVEDSINIAGNMTITGDLFVNGTQTVVDTAVLSVADNIIDVNAGELGNGVTAGTAGLRVKRGEMSDMMMIFDESDDKFKVGLNGTTLETIATREWVGTQDFGSGSVTNVTQNLTQNVYGSQQVANFSIAGTQSVVVDSILPFNFTGSIVDSGTSNKMKLKADSSYLFSYSMRIDGNDGQAEFAGVGFYDETNSIMIPSPFLLALEPLGANGWVTDGGWSFTYIPTIDCVVYPKWTTESTNPAEVRDISLQVVETSFSTPKTNLTATVQHYVGEGQQFTTIQSAIDYALSTYVPVSNLDEYKVEIILKTGFIIKEQVKLNNVDASFITIKSEDASVQVDRTFITVIASAGERPSVFEFIRCKAPEIGILMAWGTALVAGDYMGYVFYRSEGSFLAGAGSKYSPYAGLFASYGSNVSIPSTVWEYSTRGIWALGKSEVSGNSLQASYCGTGILLDSGSSYHGVSNTIKNCTSVAVYCTNGSNAYISNQSAPSDLSNSNQGVSSSFSSTVSAPYCVAKNCGDTAFISTRLGSIQADYSNCDTSNYGVRAYFAGNISFYSGSAKTCGKNAMNASSGGNIYADYANASGSGVDGDYAAVVATYNSYISFGYGVATGTKYYSILAGQNSSVNASYSNCSTDGTPAEEYRCYSNSFIAAVGATGQLNCLPAANTWSADNGYIDT
jgi:hypothetical protein